MPGIYGYLKNHSSEISQLNKMSNAMYTHPHFIQDFKFEDENIAASRVHIGVIGESRSPTIIDSIYIWIEGESYNLDNLSKIFNFQSSGLAESLIEAYQKKKLNHFLHQLDGYFCAILYDTKEKKVKLISDRYGMRPLYWYSYQNTFAWASEIKGILSLDNLNKEIDPNAFPCFLDLGYLLDEHTWFQHIKLIKPASIIDIDINSKKTTHTYYWKWSEIKKSSLSFDDAIDELGKRFLEAIKRRFTPHEMLGVSLSGGLDSRAIVAGLAHLFPDYKGYSYTFGIQGCDDILISQKVSSISNWQHDIFPITNTNWISPRISKVWNTDGMFDIRHMHGSEFSTIISKKLAINMNGYAGDAILGGSFLRKLKLDTRATKSNVAPFIKKWSHLLKIEDSFYDIEKIEPILYMNRIRRFTNMGSINLLPYIAQRKPFFDNSVVELIFSLPDKFRKNNRLYSAMLIKFFPEYFKNIPWEKTGYPISKNRLCQFSALFLKKYNSFLKEKLQFLIPGFKTLSYVDYPTWVRENESNIRFFLNKESILVKESIFPKLGLLLNTHFSVKEDLSDKILRLLTIEIYLQNLSGSFFSDPIILPIKSEYTD